ncbi:MAG TPA: RnfABCDGE type electron transport complex subunit D, partial [Fibrobacteraceae bacterium]|nr:RnfABCDGE type electron transport complex subunit D [Fibrobacteraceae bacterium]
HVVFALLPLVAYAIYNFGWSALLVITVSTGSAVGVEFLYNRITSREQSIGDYSAVITGILLGLTLPPGFPLWMTFVGGAMAVLLGKMIFGGLGSNPFNPALVGRAFLQTAFPAAMTTWTDALRPDRWSVLNPGTLAWPLLQPSVDGTAGATPLSAFKFGHVSTPVHDLFLGGVSGSAGETATLLILLCGTYLAVRRMLDWRIPVGVLVSAAVLSALLHGLHPQYPSALFSLTSGGLALGAVFMATDMATSPVTPLGTWIYSIFIGLLVVTIRIWGGLCECVMYVILLANAITPLLNRWCMPRVYGTRRRP